MAKKSRQKGVRGELEAAKLLKPVFPGVRRRGFQARGGHEGADLDGTPGWHVEVGVGAVNPATKWEQACSDQQQACVDSIVKTGEACADDTPIALTRRDHGEWLVTISAAAWMALLRAQEPQGEAQEVGPVSGAIAEPDRHQRAMAGLPGGEEES